MSVGVGGHDHTEATVAGAEVGLVLRRMNDERPAVLLLKVDGEGPEAAVGFGRVRLLVANLSKVSLIPIAHPVLFDLELDVRSLKKKRLQFLFSLFESGNKQHTFSAPKKRLSCNKRCIVSVERGYFIAFASSLFRLIGSFNTFVPSFESQ